MARKYETSAGLLVFRRRKQPEFLLAHPGGPFWSKKDDGAWTIPKGLATPGDDLLAAAQREFTEETGFVADGRFLPLPPARQKSGKAVHAWALEHNFDLGRFSSNEFEMEWPPRSGQRRSFPEIDRLGWFDYDTARKKIIAYQQPFLTDLLRILDSGRSD